MNHKPNKIAILLAFLLFVSFVLSVFNPSVLKGVQGLEDTEEPSGNIIDSVTGLGKDVYMAEARDPVLFFDGANYIYNTSFGVYTWFQPLYYYKFAFHNNSELVKRAYFVLQENSSGTWLPLLSYQDVTVVEAANDTFTVEYKVQKKVKGIDYIVANVSLSMVFRVADEPKISVHMVKHHWENTSLTNFRWLWIIGFAGGWKYWSDQTQKTNVDLTSFSQTSIGSFSEVHIAEQSDFNSSRNWLTCQWGKYHVVQAGKDVAFNEKGIAVVYPTDQLDVDPIIVASVSTNIATQYETQRKVFHNPSGLEYYYALFMNNTGGVEGNYWLYIYKSADGETWVPEDTLLSWSGAFHTPPLTAIDYGGASLDYNVNATHTIVHIVYSKSVYRPYYRRGAIPHGSSSITWETTHQFGWYDPPNENNRYRPAIVRGKTDGFLYVATRTYGDLMNTEYYYCNGRDTVGGRDDWSKVGSNPYLDVQDDGSYVYEGSRNDIQGDFKFDDPLMMGNQREIEVYAKTDTNDYFEVYVSGNDGSSWTYAGDIHPTLGYVWWSVDVTAILNTGAKLIAAEMYLKKKNTGSADVVYADCARLKILSTGIVDGYATKIIASNVTNPTSSADWGNETTIWESGDVTLSHKVFPTISSFQVGASVDVLVAASWYDEVVLTSRYSACEYSWNGSVFTRGNKQTWKSSGGYPQNSIAIDSNNMAHCAMKGMTNDGELRRWNMTVGWNEVGGVFDLSVGSLQTSIMNNPERIYLFYTTSFSASSKNLTVQSRLVTSTSFWSGREYINVTQDEDALTIKHFSTYQYFDSYNQTGLLYTTQRISAPYEVGFYKYPFQVQYELTFYFNSGGTLLVNGTITSNATATSYGENQVVNITAVPSAGYQFDNHTYDSSSTTSNPFYLTVTQAYIVWTYFNVTVVGIIDCNWIGVNNTVQGLATLFSSNWEDVNQTNGLSHSRFSTNNTGAWIYDAWTDVWYDSNWTRATKTLNDTAGLVIAFRWLINDTSGTEFNGTICFFTIQLEGAEWLQDLTAYPNWDVLLFTFLGIFFTALFLVQKSPVWGWISFGAWLIDGMVWLLINPVSYGVSLLFFAIAIIILILSLILQLERLKMQKKGLGEEMQSPV